MAAQAGMGLVDWGNKKNPLVEAVEAISITGRELTPEEEELERIRGPKVADRIEDDPRFRPRKQDRTDMVRYGPAEDDVIPRWVIEGDDCGGDNRSGSFEALMAGWGSARGAAFETKAVQGG